MKTPRISKLEFEDVAGFAQKRQYGRLFAGDFCNVTEENNGRRVDCIEPLSSKLRPAHHCSNGRCKFHCDKSCRCPR